MKRILLVFASALVLFSCSNGADFQNDDSNAPAEETKAIREYTVKVMLVSVNDAPYYNISVNGYSGQIGQDVYFSFSATGYQGWDLQYIWHNHPEINDRDDSDLDYKYLPDPALKLPSSTELWGTPIVIKNPVYFDFGLPAGTTAFLSDLQIHVRHQGRLQSFWIENYEPNPDGSETVVFTVGENVYNVTIDTTPTYFY